MNISPRAQGAHYSANLRYQNMASRTRGKMNKSPCSFSCGLAAVQRDSAMFYIGSSFLYSGIRRVMYPAAMPLDAAQRARRSAGRYSSFHFYSRFSFALPAKLDVPSFLYWFRITTSLITHVSQLLGTRLGLLASISQLLGTRLGLLASICQSTTRTQVMTRL